jgi:hypothetical protein
MDFNTGTGGTGGPGGSSQQSPGAAPPRVSTTGEFTYADPVQSFIGTVRGVLTQPVAFFRGMARGGDFLNPLLFALICYEISAIVGGVLGVLGSIVGIGSRGVGGAFGTLAATIFVTPIVGAIGLLIATAIFHLLVILIVKPVSSGFETTWRVASYSSVGQLISWIPILGPLVAGVIFIVLAVLGIRESHSTTTGKAALVVLIPVAVFTLILLILAAVVGALIFSVLSNQ